MLGLNYIVKNMCLDKSNNHNNQSSAPVVTGKSLLLPLLEAESLRKELEAIRDYLEEGDSRQNIPVSNLLEEIIEEGKILDYLGEIETYSVREN